MHRSNAPATRPVVLACWILAFVLPADTWAGRWYWQSGLSTFLDYQSNLTLSNTDDEAAVREAIETSALLGYEDEQSKLVLDSRLSGQLVQGVKDRNTADVSFELTSDHQTEMDLYSLNARLVLDSTLTSELEPGGTGFVQERKDRTLIQVSPSWRHDLSENGAVVFGATALDVTYEDEELIPLTNYRYFTLSGGYASSFLQRWRFNANVQFARFESSATTETLTGLIGADWEMDELNAFSGSIGLSRASSDQRPTGGGEDQEFRFNFDYSVALEKSRLNAAISRTESPDGSGELRTSNALNLAWLQELDNTLKLRATTQLGESEGAQANSREYRSASVSLIKDLSRESSLEVGYRGFWQAFDAGRSATNHVIQLSFRKRWKERPLW